MTERQLLHEIGQTVPFRSLAQEAVVAIHRTAGILAHRYDLALQPHDVTMPQYNVLRILRGAKGPVRTLEIGERMVARTPGITRLIDRLVEKGLVQRERCAEDRRVVYCAITEAGLAVLRQTDDLIEELDAAVGSGLSEAQLVSLVEALEVIRHG